MFQKGLFIHAFIWLQECIESEVCGIKSSNNCDNMASWPSNLIKLLRFLKVKASKSIFGLWLLRFLRFRRPTGTIMALLLFAALLLLLILMLLVFKFYDEFITCFHEFWIYETCILFPMKFPVCFDLFKINFHLKKNKNRLKKIQCMYGVPRITRFQSGRSSI